MTPQELIDIQMTYHFETWGLDQLIRKVKEVVDRGIWHDAFLPAFVDGDLTSDQADRVLDAMLAEHPECRLDMGKMKAIVEQYFPYSRLSWLLGPDGALVMTDSVRLAKIVRGELAWIEPIPGEMFGLEKVENGMVIGSFYDHFNSLHDHIHPLRFAYEDGGIIED